MAELLGKLRESRAEEGVPGASLSRIFTEISSAARTQPDQVFQDIETVLPKHLPIKDTRVVVWTGSQWTAWRDQAIN